MKTIKLLIIITIMVTISSCIDSKKNNEEILVCKYNKNVDLLKNKPLFKLIKVVPLETVDESLIIQINQIAVFNDKLIILDRIQNKVLAFDDNGNYLNSIKIGKGPGELIMPGHLEVSKNGKFLYVSDLYREIKCYDEELNFIKTINPQKLGFLSFYEIENNQFLLSNETNKSKTFYYSIYDSNKKDIIKEFEKKNQDPYPNYTCVIADNFVNLENNLTLNCIPYSKYIRIINNKKKTVKKICRLDLGIYDNKSLSYLAKNKKGIEFTEICRNEKKISYFSGFLKISPNKYLFRFYELDGLSYGIADISNQNISLYTINKIYPYNLDFMTYPIGYLNGQFICYGQITKIIKYKDKNKSELNINSELSKLINTNEYDNPILFYYEICKEYKD